MKNSQNAPSLTGYRADIDGLRAVSVIAVVAFHIGLPGFGGGYIGVDVFFVISGYLITLLLVGPSDDTLMRRLCAFYVRRARRILPALIVLLSVSALVAVVLFLPADLRKYGRTLALAAAMLGNVGAWLNGGYYDTLGRHAPLQHLWSIGVEEQFYLVFPIVLLLAGHWFREHRWSTVAILTIGSFALCMWASYRFPSANYYASPTRAWQLLVGSLVALGATRWPLRGRWNELVAAASLIGLVVIVYSYSSTTRYPGLAALAPTLATAALLVTGTSGATLAGRALSLQPLVFTGLISYSLYLWHAPILAFVEYWSIEQLSVASMCAVLLSIYAVSTLSWAIVERPLRTRRLLSSNTVFIWVAVGSLALLAVVGVVFSRTGGMPHRFSPEVYQLTEGIDHLYGPARDCATVSMAEIRVGRLCAFGSNDPGARRVVVWGDSHALALLPAYESLAQSRGMRLYLGAISACRPLLGVRSRYDSEYRRVRCVEFNEAMMQAVEVLDPHVIVFNAYWGYPDTDLVASDDEPARADAAWRLGLVRVLDRVRAPPRAACVILSAPTYKQVVPYALAMAQRSGRGDDVVAMSRTAAFEQYAIVERAMHSLAAAGRLRVVDPKELLCPRATCELRTPAGALLYRDAHHLSIEGARYVSPVLEGCLQTP